jgi:hypothetical protein
MTRRWREMDSNHRYRIRNNPFGYPVRSRPHRRRGSRRGGGSGSFRLAHRQAGRALRARRLGPQERRTRPHHRPADRRDYGHSSVGRSLRRLARRRVRIAGPGRDQRCRRHRAGPASRRNRTFGDRPTSDLGAYDLYLRALPMLARISKEGLSEAARFLEQAIARDPGYGPALAFAAICHQRLATVGSPTLSLWDRSPLRSPDSGGSTRHTMPCAGRSSDRPTGRFRHQPRPGPGCKAGPFGRRLH